MEQKRPTALTVMGILNIVLGSLALLCTCFEGLGMLVLSNLPAELRQDPNIKAAAEPFEKLMREVPEYLAVFVSQAIAALCLALLLIVSGIGLLYVKRWARLGCIFYVAIRVPLSVANLIYALTVVNPVVARIQPAAGDALVNNVLAAVGAMFHVGYAVVLLIVLLLPGVAAAFTPRLDQPSPEEGAAYDDLDLRSRDDY
jgi:hypothetical protein